MKKSYTNENDNKIIKKFYPQSTTNKENKQIDFESHLVDNISLEDNSKSNQNNKFGVKWYNYHTNFTQGGIKTPSNRAQNLGIKYQLVRKDSK